MRPTMLYFAVFSAITFGLSAHAGEPVVLAEGEGKSRAQQPQAFVAEDGTIDVVYAFGDQIRLTTSRDGGTTFVPAKTAIAQGRLASGMRRGPRVVRTRAALTVTAVVGEKGSGVDGDVTAWRSTDDGATWSRSVRINDVAGSGREGLHGMTASSDGTVWCVWLDLRDRRTDVFAASSRDGGATWSENRLVYRSPDRSVCECCHPSIATDDAGRVSVLFRNSVAGDRDMYLARSDDGRAFAPAAKLGRGSWKLNACPMDGGTLATDGRDKTLTIWKRANGLFEAAPGDESERELGPGEQPWLAWSAAGPVAVWTLAREGTLALRIGRTGRTQVVAENARYPTIASRPSSDSAIVCWEEKDGERTRVLARAISLVAPTKSVQ